MKPRDAANLAQLLKTVAAVSAAVFAWIIKSKPKKKS